MIMWNFGDYQRMHLGFLVLIVCFSISGICCGGAQESNGYNCEKEKSEILGTEIADYCEGSFVRQLEGDIDKFRSKCPSLAKQYKSSLDDKMYQLPVCAEKQLILDELRGRCQRQMEQAAANMNCIGNECVPYMDHVTGIAESCDDPGLKGVYLAKADALHLRLKVRIEQADALTSFVSLEHFCDSNQEKITPMNAREIFGKTIKNIKKKGSLESEFPQDSEIEVVRSNAFESCEQVIQSAMEIITREYSKKLKDPQVKMDKKRWKRNYKKLKKYRASLNRINGETFFPESLEMVNSTIEEFSTD